MSQKIEDRLERLISIYSIPLEENWNDVLFSNYTVYHYWNSLGLISNDDLLLTLKDKKIKKNKSLSNFFNFFDVHFSPSFYQNGKVADVGSGFGFITFWLILSDAKKVYSIGDSDRISFINRLYKRAVEKGLISKNKLQTRPEHIKVGDITLADCIEDGSLDMVLLNDTLEHISPRIFPYLVKASYNNLKQGGVFISRQQNTSSKKMVKSLIPLWESKEENEHIPQRLKIIQNKIENIDKASAYKLAQTTRGLDSIDFYKAIDNFINHKLFPNLNDKRPPIDVLTDVPDEGDTNIERICLEFKQQGFSKIKVYPELMDSRISRSFQTIAKFFPSIFFNFQLFDKTTVFFIEK